MDNSRWFSQFEQDAMAINLVAAYFHNNNIYRQLVKKPGVTQPNIALLLSQADTLSGEAIAALQAFDNVVGIAKGKQAHALVLQAANLLQVSVQPNEEQVVRNTPPVKRTESRRTLREIKRRFESTVDTASGMGATDYGAFGYDPLLADTLTSHMANRPAPPQPLQPRATTFKNALSTRPALPRGPLPVPAP